MKLNSWRQPMSSYSLTSIDSLSHILAPVETAHQHWLAIVSFPLSYISNEAIHQSFEIPSLRSFCTFSRSLGDLTYLFGTISFLKMTSIALSLTVSFPSTAHLIGMSHWKSELPLLIQNLLGPNLMLSSWNTHTLWLPYFCVGLFLFLYKLTKFKIWQHSLHQLMFLLTSYQIICLFPLHDHFYSAVFLHFRIYDIFGLFYHNDLLVGFPKAAFLNSTFPNATHILHYIT